MWSKGGFNTAEENFLYHYNKHVIKQLEWNEVISPEVYKQNAIDLINRGEGVEAYYQIGKENILVYNRADNQYLRH